MWFLLVLCGWCLFLWGYDWICYEDCVYGWRDFCRVVFYKGIGEGGVEKE